MIYQLLDDQKDFQRPIKYKAKSLEFIAIIDDSPLSKHAIKKITSNSKVLQIWTLNKLTRKLKATLGFQASFKHKKYDPVV